MMVENIKTQVVILEHEDKTSKGFDYTRFKCEYQDEGGVKWMSAFNKTTAEQQMVKDLKESEGKVVSVEVCNPKDDLWNIKKFNGVVRGSPQASVLDKIPVEKPLMQDPSKHEPADEDWDKKIVRKSVKGSNYEKDPVGLAVEIYCKLMEDKDFKESLDSSQVMEVAVKLVKQAQEAFS